MSFRDLGLLIPSSAGSFSCSQSAFLLEVVECEPGAAAVSYPAFQASLLFCFGEKKNRRVVMSSPKAGSASQWEVCKVVPGSPGSECSTCCPCYYHHHSSDMSLIRYGSEAQRWSSGVQHLLSMHRKRKHDMRLKMPRCNLKN